MVVGRIVLSQRANTKGTWRIVLWTRGVQNESVRDRADKRCQGLAGRRVGSESGWGQEVVLGRQNHRTARVAKHSLLKPTELDTATWEILC